MKNVPVVSFVVGALGCVTEVRIGPLQETTLSETARIIRKVLDF